MKTSVSMILIILLTIPLTVKAEIKTQSFYDFVREEKRKEIAGDEFEAKESDAFLERRKTFAAEGVSAVAFLAVFWALLMSYINKNYLSPYKIIRNEDNFRIEELTPLEVSAIINVNEFSKYDLIAALFELLRRKALVIDDINAEELKIRKNPMPAEISEYEDFLIRWFAGKIGGGEYFSFKRLRKYLELDSQAVEFGIDYDVWNDEITDALEIEVVDKKAEKWKFYCALIGLAYGVLGIILLYLTNSVLSVALFCFTYLSYRISDKSKRRTADAEALYWKIMNCGEVTDTENTDLPDKRFVYGIVLNSAVLELEKYDKYAALYAEAETVIGFAEALANKLGSDQK